MEAIITSSMVHWVSWSFGCLWLRKCRLENVGSILCQDEHVDFTLVFSLSFTIILCGTIHQHHIISLHLYLLPLLGQDISLPIIATVPLISFRHRKDQKHGSYSQVMKNNRTFADFNYRGIQASR